MLSDHEKVWLEEVYAREKAATPGPWMTWAVGTIVAVENRNAGEGEKTDTIFIAHARTDIPRLLDLVRKLQEAEVIAFKDGWTAGATETRNKANAK